MTDISSLRRSKVRARPVTALVGTLLLCVLMWTLRDELNPDWFGYQRIYEDGGSWLAAQGRDPLFLSLTSAVAWFLGPTSYEGFRIGLGAYFALFMYQLLAGHVIAFDTTRHHWPLLFLGIIPLAATRFTVQIREGLAATLVLIAMASLQRRPAAAALGPFMRRCLSFLLLGVAYAIHSAAGILLVAWLGAYAIEHVGQRSTAAELERLRGTSLVTLAFACVVGYYFSSEGGGGSAVDAFYGWAAESELTVSLGKYLYWGAYGVGIWHVRAHLLSLYRSSEIERRLRVFLGVLGLALLPAVYATAVVLLLMSAPAITISSAARMMNLLLSLLIAFFAIRGKLTRHVAIFALFVLFDQARVIYESILNTFSEGA
jgi:hypothetical protein